MAFWQYSFWAVPKNKLIEVYSLLPNKITEHDFNELKWFSGFTDINQLINSIDYLSKGNHWNKDTEFWGEYESDSISLLYQNNELCEVFIRLDLRKDYTVMINNVVRMLLTNELLIIDESLNVISPDLNIIINEINLKTKGNVDYFK